MSEATQDLDDVAAEAALRARRARSALEHAPELAQHLRTLALRTDGRTEPGIDMRVEATPLHARRVDDLDELYTVLLEWVGFWAAEYQVTAPATAAVAWRTLVGEANDGGTAIAGLPASTTPKGAAGLTWHLTMWLLTHHDRFATHDVAATYHDEITTLVWSLRSRSGLTDAPVRSSRGRLCPLDCSADDLGDDLTVAGVTAAEWAEHRDNPSWRREHFPHHFTVHGEFFGEPLTAAEHRGERVRAWARSGDETAEQALHQFLTAVDGIQVRCSRCGWTADAKPTKLARWLS